MDRIEQIKEIAERHNWFFAKWQEDIKMLSFKKEGSRINIYITKMTVGTAVDHPRYGKGQLYRRHVSLDLLEQIFINPRVHTTKGYYLRKDRV